MPLSRCFLSFVGYNHVCHVEFMDLGKRTTQTEIILQDYVPSCLKGPFQPKPFYEFLCV